MPELVDDTIEEGQSNLLPGIAGAAGIGLGSALLGPGLGVAGGGTVAGAYVGGTAGTVLTVASMAFGFASLLFGNPFGSTATMNAGGGQQRQAVK